MVIFHSDVKLSEGHTGDVPNVVRMLFVEVIVNTSCIPTRFQFHRFSLKSFNITSFELFCTVMYCKYLQMVFIQHNYRKCPKWFYPSLLNYSKMVLMDLNSFNSSCITQKPWWVFKLHPHRRRSWANNAWLSRCHRSARSGPCLQPLSLRNWYTLWIPLVNVCITMENHHV